VRLGRTAADEGHDQVLALLREVGKARGRLRCSGWEDVRCRIIGMGSSNEAVKSSAGPGGKCSRRDCFWATLFLLAALMLFNVTVSMLGEFFRGPSWTHRLGIVVFGPVGFLFWYWIMAGSWRRSRWARPDLSPADSPE